jgi:hypothetical protein
MLNESTRKRLVRVRRGFGKPMPSPLHL